MFESSASIPYKLYTVTGCANLIILYPTNTPFLYIGEFSLAIWLIIIPFAKLLLPQPVSCADWAMKYNGSKLYFLAAFINACACPENTPLPWSNSCTLSKLTFLYLSTLKNWNVVWEALGFIAFFNSFVKWFNSDILNWFTPISFI